MMSPRRAAAKPENTRLRNAVEFVKLGFGDDFGFDLRSLYFRTDELTTDEAQAVVKLINYDEFDGVKVAEQSASSEERLHPTNSVERDHLSFTSIFQLGRTSGRAPREVSPNPESMTPRTIR